MAKSPKKRNNRRHNPVRVPDSHLGPGLSNAARSTAPNRAEEVLPILKKLESSDANERTWACAAVTNLIQNDPSIRRLLQGKNVIGLLITRLSDSVDDVVVEASGALRNLCIDGGYEICGEMYNKNILAPLKALMAKVAETLTALLSTSSPKPKPSGGLNTRVYELAENVITMFWCLSETSNKSLTAINNANVVPFLMAFLSNRDRIPTNAVVAAAQCLYVLSDDNRPVAEAIKANKEYVSCLISLIKSSVSEADQGDRMTLDSPSSDETNSSMLRVLACGTLKNISPLPVVVPASSYDVDAEALPILLPLLSYDLQQASNKAYDLIMNPQPEPKEKEIKHAPKSDHKTASEIELEKLENELRTVQLALEVLTSICAQLPDPEPGISETDGDVEIEDDNEPLDETTEDFIIHQNEPQPNGIDTNNLNTLSLLSTLTPPLLQLARPTPLSFPPPSSQAIHPPTTSALGVIHVRALECLNNLFLSVNHDLLPQGAKSAVESVWSDVWKVLVLVGQQSEWMVGLGQERRKEMWDVAVGALWGLARIGRSELVPDAEQILALMEYCDSTKDDQTKVKCIGTLGCLAQRPDAVEANKVISTYLFNFVSSCTSQPQTQPVQAESVLHAVSLLIDIYSDEDLPYDINFRQMGWLNILVKAIPGMKPIVKSIDRRREGGKELRAFGDEVLTNLVAFVQYRKKLKL